MMADHPVWVDEEQRKAAFLTEYRALCEKHGMVMDHVCPDPDEDEADEDDEEAWTWPYAVCDISSVPDALEVQIQEALIEPVYHIVNEDDPRLEDDAQG